MTATETLLPCPFCGGEAHIITAVGESWVLCIKCKATSEAHTDKQFAIAAWNRRAEQPTLSDLYGIWKESDHD